MGPAISGHFEHLLTSTYALLFQVKHILAYSYIPADLPDNQLAGTVRATF